MLSAALQQQVAFVPGASFFMRAAAGRTRCRLNFSNATPEKIEEGIARLGRVLHAQVPPLDGARSAQPAREPVLSR